jgi:hypothetical protein
MRAVALGSVVWLAALIGLWVTSARGADGETEAATAEAIEAGRQSLEKGYIRERYPWYDSEADDVRRINVKTPWSWDWSWWTSFWSWLFGLFSGWNFDFKLFGRSFSFFQVRVWLGLLTLAVGLIYLLTKVYLRKEAADHARHGAQATEADVDRVEALPEAARRHVADLLAEARRAYELGNFGEAIVYLFSHQLLQLDRRHLIRLTKGKTNRQYLREIGPRRALANLVERTMVAFEDVFFGAHVLDRDRFEACWSQLGRFDQLVEEGGA